MTFIVFDQGYRTETPWYDLFPPKQVNPTQASQALHAPSTTLEKESKGQQHLPPGQKQPYQQATEIRRRIGCASDIMSQPVFSAQPEQTLQMVSAEFEQHSFHHMPVLGEHGKLVGMLSDRDLLRHQAAQRETTRKQAPSQPIKDIMTQRVLTAQPQTGIPQLAEVMVKHRIGALPIVDADGQLLGMITRQDILRAIMTEAPIELWA